MFQLFFKYGKKLGSTFWDSGLYFSDSLYAGMETVLFYRFPLKTTKFDNGKFVWDHDCFMILQQMQYNLVAII